MKGLLLKEWYMSWPLFLILVLLPVLVPITDGAYLGAAGCCFAMLLGMFPIASIAADRKSRFDRYHRTMPCDPGKLYDPYYLLLPVVLFLVSLLFLLRHIGHMTSYNEIEQMVSGFGVWYLSVPHISPMTRTQIACAQTVFALLPPAVYLPVVSRFGVRAGGVTEVGCLTGLLLLMNVLNREYLFGFAVYELEGLFCAAALAVICLFVISRMITAEILRRKLY